MRRRLWPHGRRPVAAAGACALAVVLVCTGFGVPPQATAAPTDPVAAASNPIVAAPTPRASPSAAPGPTTPAVTVTLTSLNPPSPDATKPAQVVTIQATVTNNSDIDYTDFRLVLERGHPITQQSLLDEALSTPPSTNDLVPHPVDQAKPLAAHTSQAITFLTSPDSPAMCLCNIGVYPYALVVEGQSASNGIFREIARMQVLVPSFPDGAPKPVQLAWVWPLIDRPHRGTSDTTFTDDDLAASVATGGRLDRALRVAELLAGKVRLTLLVDPELIDALTTISSAAGYKITNGTTEVTGVGGPAARDWLARLKKISTQHDIVVTPYADPDVDATSRAGLKWSNSLDAELAQRLTAVLGTYSAQLLSWPADGTLTAAGLDTLAGSGVSSVLLSDAALSSQNTTNPRPDALSPVPSASGTTVALVTDSAIEKTVTDAFTAGSQNAAAQQRLLAQLAVRAAADPTRSHLVALTPDRYVNTDPTSAASLITTVATTLWSTSITVQDAVRTIKPVDRGPLQVAAAVAGNEVTAADMTALVTLQAGIASLSAALHDNKASAALLGDFTNGIKRAQSNAWRQDRARGHAQVSAMTTELSGLTGSLHLVQPSEGTYSLSSENSPIVVTITNDLAYPASVLVTVSPGSGVVGFSASTIAVQTVPAHSRKTVSIPAHVSRLGKFQVVARMTTPEGQALGPDLHLNLRATSIGGITRVVTIVAAAFLILALLVRLLRRLRRGRAGGRDGGSDGGSDGRQRHKHRARPSASVIS